MEIYTGSQSPRRPTLTTTPTKLDLKLRTLIEAIKKAHAKSKAHGTFLALLEGSSHYYVQTDHGAVKHRYVDHCDTLTVHTGTKHATVKLVSIERKKHNENTDSTSRRLYRQNA
jgi:hypothetical protein